MTDRDELVELLSCPFCGGDAVREDIPADDTNNENAGASYITCKTCWASTRLEFGRKENLRSAWNTRAALSATPLAQGYIVGNGDRTKWRAWRDGLPVWVDDPVEATRYSFRSDANAVHAEDEDAWCIVEYKDVATPSARITGDKGGENPAEGAPLATAADKLVKHMTERFLQWKLPADFNPDGGVIFDPVGNVGTAYEYRREPFGTNLLTYTQAEAMVRHMLNGLTALRAERGDGWRTMDSAPRDGTFVQLFEPIAHPPVSVGCYDDEAGWLIGEADFMPSKCRPRYWAPLLPRPDIAPATKSESAVVSDMEAQLAEAQQIARAALEAKP